MRLYRKTAEECVTIPFTTITDIFTIIIGVAISGKMVFYMMG
jgi:hypothetical protein